jgi:superfamily II DNA or RNA helicase
MAKVGYIYVRTHEAYELYGVCKLGKTQNITNRETTYITGEFVKGDFSYVFEVPLAKMSFAEKKLGEDFKSFHERNFNMCRGFGGKEFYKKEIIPLIKEQLIKHGIEARELTRDEIKSIVRKEYFAKISKYVNKKNIPRLIKKLNNRRAKAIKPKYPVSDVVNCSYTKRDYQITIIDKSIVHFQEHNKGILVLMCGLGKTLISLWITQELKANTILIGVPNILLLDQWKKVIKELFPTIPLLSVYENRSIETINSFLVSNHQQCIVLTTYASVHKVYTATTSSGFIFDMKILDEVHHLTSHNIIEEEHKTYVKILQIKSHKQLALTATLKILESNEHLRDDEIIISNTNVEHFGEVIIKICLLWAIERKILCEYVIQTLYANEDDIHALVLKFDIKIDNEDDKRLWLSAYSALKSIVDGYSHHLLIYTNSKANSEQIVVHIKRLLASIFSIPELYYTDYNGSMNKDKKDKIITDFEKAEFGIITCVYCLGEGWDFPLLDAVVFAENMTSNIRIVQSALRASRKNAKQPEKITKIILPILNNENWIDNSNNSDWKKVREVIHQMGLEDVTISHKIKVFKINFSHGKQHIKHRPLRHFKDYESIGSYNEELTQNLLLKTVKRSSLGTSYEKAKKIIVEKNIKTKEDYLILTESDNRLTQDPEDTYRGKFTNWIDYLSIDRVYYDLETCKSKVHEYLGLYPEIKTHYFKNFDLATVCSELCAKDPLFPPYGLWVDYYNLKDLRELIVINYKKKKSPSISL